MSLLAPADEAPEDRIGDLIGIMAALVERVELLERQLGRLTRAVERIAS